MRSFNVPLSYWLPARFALGVRGPRKPILGMELAGEIAAVGKDVRRFKKGDQVFASIIEHGFGGYAEYKCLPQDGLLALKSAVVPYEQAVTLPIGGRTALYFLREAAVQLGQKVLIYGASGSVGTFAVQLAKYYGAQVTGVCSTANLELVKYLGADKVIDYTEEDFTQNGERYDVIFDTVGKSAYADSIRSLTDGGAYLNAVSSPGIETRMRWTSMTSGKRMVGGGPPPNVEDLVFLQELVEAGEIRPVIDRCYALEEIVDAHRYVDTGRKRGNVVILVSEVCKNLIQSEKTRSFVENR
jgi:NADPH:quinone reductase-like Zn-dependent oxidoreductase